jgi:hypothetical protein
MVIFQLDVVHNIGWKFISLCHLGNGIVIHKPQNGFGGIKGIKSSFYFFISTRMLWCIAFQVLPQLLDMGSKNEPLM